jgi:hypothetical protein
VPVAVTGSIATDHLMTFPGKFVEQFVEGQMENVSLSFLVDDLCSTGAGPARTWPTGWACWASARARRGGRQRLRRVRRVAHPARRGHRSVHWSELKHTARFVCTTDAANNQIASFYSGAMSEAGNIELGPGGRAGGRLDLVVIGPNDPDGDGAAHRGVPSARLRLRGRPQPAAGLGRRRDDPRPGRRRRPAVHQRVRVAPAPAEDRLGRDEVLSRVGTW